MLHRSVAPQPPARAVMVAALAATIVPAGAAPYKVDARVKDFALKDTSGKTIRLSQFKGKVVVLAFSASY